MEYAIVVVPLSEDDGGGFLGYIPDLPGCMSDGESEAEALENVKKAALDWKEEWLNQGRPMPKVGSSIESYVASLKAQFAEAIEGLSGRLEMAESDIAELREIIENLEARTRFAGLAGMSYQSSSYQAARPRCQ